LLTWRLGVLVVNRDIYRMVFTTKTQRHTEIQLLA
jgi:hypothetical protein